MNKKFIAIGAAAVLSCGAAAGLAGAQAPISLWLSDDHEIQLEADPYIENDRTMVPLYAFAEELNWHPWWIADDQDAGVYTGRYEVIFHIGEKMVEVYDYQTEERTRKPIDVAAAVVNDRTMVPVRALCENADVEVDWDAKSRKVIIKSEPDVKDTADEVYSEESVLEGLVVDEDEAEYTGFEDFDFTDDQYEDIAAPDNTEKEKK